MRRFVLLAIGIGSLLPTICWADHARPANRFTLDFNTVDATPAIVDFATRLNGALIRWWAERGERETKGDWYVAVSLPDTDIPHQHPTVSVIVAGSIEQKPILKRPVIYVFRLRNTAAAASFAFENIRGVVETTSNNLKGGQQ